MDANGPGSDLNPAGSISPGSDAALPGITESGDLGGRRILFGSCFRRRGGKTLGRAQKAELLQGRDAIVEADFLHDFSVPKLQHRRSREFHLPAGIGRQ